MFILAVSKFFYIFATQTGEKHKLQQVLFSVGCKDKKKAIKQRENMIEDFMTPYERRQYELHKQIIEQYEALKDLPEIKTVPISRIFEKIGNDNGVTRQCVCKVLQDEGVYVPSRVRAKRRCVPKVMGATDKAEA